MEEPHAQQQLQRRRDVLQQPDHAQRDPAHAVGETDQRHRRHHPAEHQQQVGAQAPRAGEATAMPGLGPQHIGQRGQEQVQAFQPQPGDRIDRDQLAHQPVQPERSGQAQRDPRRRARADRQPGHAQRRTADRDPLQPAQPLVQHQHAEHDIDQRIDEVAQAGLDHVAGVDRPDVQAPVERDQHAAERQRRQRARLRGQPPQPAPAIAQQQPADHQQRAPHHPVGHDLQRRHRLEQVPVHRHHPPDHEGRGGDRQPAAIDGRLRACAHRRSTRARVIVTTPARITAIAPRSCAVKRSPASQAPSATAIAGFT